MTKTITTVYFYESDSRPGKEYQTLKYSDGSTSCECRGWTQRVAPDGSRSCRHTRDVESGQARGCVRWYDAHKPSQTATIPTPAPTRNKTRAPKPQAERVFTFDD
jgi:hypothetical protein